MLSWYTNLYIMIKHHYVHLMDWFICCVYSYHPSKLLLCTRARVCGSKLKIQNQERYNRFQVKLQLFQCSNKNMIKPIAPIWPGTRYHLPVVKWRQDVNSSRRICTNYLLHLESSPVWCDLCGFQVPSTVIKSVQLRRPSQLKAEWLHWTIMLNLHKAISLWENTFRD